ncbi:MAG: rhodanese-like domain-containing protein [Chthoniobacterales bacterium]|nr:rhodanese-like domain-containing protein [Chthoniobacterales bacterium]
MKSRTKTAFALVLALCGGALSAHAIGWALVNAKVRTDFPDVKRITTAELASWLDDQARPAPLLLDVRTCAEYDVSHLRNAQHVEPDAPASEIAQPKNRAIVTYCSVGYRSGAFADKLLAAGYTNVVNLEGSIFRWANEARPIYHRNERVEQVHPFNRTWGLLLKRQYRARSASVGAGH